MDSCVGYKLGSSNGEVFELEVSDEVGSGYGRIFNKSSKGVKVEVVVGVGVSVG